MSSGLWLSASALGVGVSAAAAAAAAAAATAAAVASAAVVSSVFSGAFHVFASGAAPCW